MTKPSAAAGQKQRAAQDALEAAIEDAKDCYERARLDAQWKAVVAEVRRAHHRRVGFMNAFERLVAGQSPRDEPSFLERAKSGWASRGIS